MANFCKVIYICEPFHLILLILTLDAFTLPHVSAWRATYFCRFFRFWRDPPSRHGNARSAQGKRAYVGIWGRLMYNGHLFYDYAATEGAYRHSRAPAAHPKLSYTFTAYAPTLAPPLPPSQPPPLFYDTKCNTLRAIFICVLAGIATISILH